MIVDIGNFALSLNFFLAVLSIIVIVAGLVLKAPPFFESAKRISICIFGLNVIAYGVLTYAFLIGDFSVGFVLKNSSTDLPWYYRITAAWGGMDGSLLLWGMILSLCVALIVHKEGKTERAFLPHTLAVMNVIQGFLSFLLMTYSNPLARVLPLAKEGRGMNPLLQDPGMIVHPPLLYMGFICLSIPFGYAMGSLLARNYSNDWILVSRRWTLGGWFFLTIGMLVGGQWAYYELGWGGYWAWDPVENSSLMPWLTATAFLHSVIVQEKRNVFKIWNITLIIITFTLTILGTFITRSGVLNSVHAFAETNIGPVFLVFLGIELLLAFGLLFYRLPELETKHKTYGIFCRENSFILNNIVLIVIMFTVLFGTIFPLLAEGLADRKISIQAPYFNRMSFPFAALLLILMAATPFVAWQKGNMKSLRRYLLIPLIISVLIFAFFYFFLLPNLSFALLGSLIYFVFHAILAEMQSTMKGALARKKSAQKEKKLFSTIFKDRRRWGGLFVHLAVIMVFVGVIGNFFKTEVGLTMKPGERQTVGDFTLFYRTPEVFNKLNTEQNVAVFDIYKDNELVTTLKPAKAFYPTSPEPVTEAAIYRTIWRDLYLSLASLNEDNSASLTVYINPLILLIPGSFLFFALGTLLSFSYENPILIRRKLMRSASQ